MVASNALTPRVTQFLARTGVQLTDPDDDWIAELVAAADEFNLAPDVWIDVSRLPREVVDLASLVEYLRTLKTELNNPTDETKTSGRLKLYKLFVCAIHAYAGYLEDVPDFAQNASQQAADVLEHALENPPAGLSAKARTLWAATFQPTNVRAKNCVGVLIYFGQQRAAAVPAPPVADDGAQELE